MFAANFDNPPGYRPWRRHGGGSELTVRRSSVRGSARERILAQRDLEQLERWLEQAAVAASVAEVFGEPS